MMEHPVSSTYILFCKRLSEAFQVEFGLMSSSDFNSRSRFVLARFSSLLFVFCTAEAEDLVLIRVFSGIISLLLSVLVLSFLRFGWFLPVPLRSLRCTDYLFMGFDTGYRPLEL